MNQTLDPAPSSALERPLVGVLALQGDVREHEHALREGGADVVKVRRPEELERLDGLVLPGGESTAIDKLARTFGVAEPLKERIAGGLPVYGSCAGLILLADRLADPATDLSGVPQQTFGGIDMLVRRNAFGRQVDSFEADLDIAPVDAVDPGSPRPVRAVFIRAPWVESVGDGVDVLATVPVTYRHAHDAAEHRADAGAPDADGAEAGGVARIVAVRSGNLLATSFHPEVTGERRIHRLFIQIIRGEA
ncbi:pyridoxal 5'-phosphate synthase glutaminase subunit PdxT [Zhihengliuella sp.]|uniref:pyridoxal 5'-phosphate synthase glutaminase subunit PdxT n=1 Tax=Zhihengliuella sp. TaxID=1954483 RepID=UPI002811D587|nr:pyridoxal 5'-phosphate synthase glutaminase subunit PdxT [Zhihengliuella sp.]